MPEPASPSNRALLLPYAVPYAVYVLLGSAPLPLEQIYVARLVLTGTALGAGAKFPAKALMVSALAPASFPFPAAVVAAAAVALASFLVYIKLLVTPPLAAIVYWRVISPRHKSNGQIKNRIGEIITS